MPPTDTVYVYHFLSIDSEVLHHVLIGQEALKEFDERDSVPSASLPLARSALAADAAAQPSSDPLFRKGGLLGAKLSHTLLCFCGEAHPG